MKRIIIFLFAFCTISLAADAQQYILSEFTLCVAKMKHGLPIREKFNYNCKTQRMEFMDGENVMELSNPEQVDTLFLPGHKMIPYAGRFLDITYRCPSFTLAVDYKAKRENQGKVGAMGIKTQGSVESIDMRIIGQNPGVEHIKNIEVWKEHSDNGYYLVQKSRMKRFVNAKTLLKIIPEKKVQLDAYLGQHKTDFNDPDQVLELLKEIL